ncbi:ester cyclase [Nonomuraea diastatica]|uniref:ester cyclase n=1 Tax=Nonomuraea diastatica TaxID=1848329 RepID=UPI00140AD3DD|nr:ester cyclase [Nonomuraea diastatica]
MSEEPRNTDPSAVVRRFVEAFQAGGQVEVGEELLATGFRNHTPDPGSPGDRDGVLAWFAMLHAGVPDLRVELHDMVADGDRVATRKTFHGTHRGELMGVPPSGRRLAIEVIDVVRVRDGQIVEHWNAVDRLAILRQLGPASLLRAGLRRATTALATALGHRPR